MVGDDAAQDRTRYHSEQHQCSRITPNTRPIMSSGITRMRQPTIEVIS